MNQLSHVRELPLAGLFRAHGAAANALNPAQKAATIALVNRSLIESERCPAARSLRISTRTREQRISEYAERQVMAYDKRKHLRQDFRQPAFIRNKDGEALRDCALADISEGGARIAFVQRRAEDTENPELPKRFVLALTPDNRVVRFCEQVWAVGHEIGVRFLRTKSQAA